MSLKPFDITKNLFSLILPATVLIIIPFVIIKKIDFSRPVRVIAGGIISLIGLMIIAATVRMFILIGRGTLAPWSPTRKLVTQNFFAHVRNPMILGVLTVLTGETIYFWSGNMMIWTILFFLINTIYLAVSEEPGLAERFGEEYSEYKQNVPRWLPRITAWKSDTENKLNRGN